MEFEPTSVEWSFFPKELFPSPCGVMEFERIEIDDAVILPIYSFRPLAG